jgi:L-arabinose isomerase
VPDRIALVEPYWDFWERSVPFDLRADRAAMGQQVRRALDVEWVEPEAADAVLVLQTMATPPAWTLTELGALPVVVWAAHGGDRSLAEGFDHGAITSEGATVGAPMLTSLLVRAGRPFEIVLGRIDDAEAQAEVAAALAGACAAHRLGRARIGRVGRPLDGYDCVDTDDALLRRATGIESVAIEPGELRELYLDVGDERVGDLERETRAAYDVEIEGDGLQRSLRAACALDDLVARDVLTAVAMLAGKLLGGAAQYHELEAVDYETGELVLATSGEFDLGLAPDVRPGLIANDWFATDPRRGACACFSAPAGPATLIGFAQVAEGYRLIAAEGDFTGRAFPATGTANGGFRFAAGLDGWTAWCRAGASHHSSATPGAFGPRIEALGRFLGVEAVRV